MLDGEKTNVPSNPLAILLTPQVPFDLTWPLQLTGAA